MQEILVRGSYGGIGRLAYFLGLFGAMIVWVAVGLLTTGQTSVLPLVNNIGAAVVALLLLTYRLRNIGMSDWWAFLTFVPIANIWLGFMALTAPKGYVETRRLDRAGRVLTYVLLALFGIGWVLFILAIGVYFFISCACGPTPPDAR